MFTYSSSSEKCLLLVKHDQIVMQTNHRRTTRDKTDSPREIKQRNSAQATKKKETSGNHRAKTKDNITSNQLSTQP